ncbi:alpha/beta fold hydrolase [Pseudonocardia abyssalis]|uniref:Alpha/beta fold hydrolase n=1 Tax=Pseudonocardia abyssalis TaxID=2792008 RepID=A0ABS6UPP6_9PSEU|nr:alpha/beta fold hydrolase [Pseudonocardia abyssalis]MBW0115568.1 alpha/beta fold hydrolase [Pseudonocardia abyssalis]MBW0134202.1 alpha/beta fold hydrolase [Pseudonocardia abyssalis]
MAVTRRIPGLLVTEHEIAVPLDHSAPGGEQITVFAREVADPDGLDRPYLVYLQGGPGFEGPRPTRRPPSPGWLDRALADFRVLMLDQRGTGRSTPVGPATLVGRTPAEQAAYLTYLRADAIVADAEALRAHLGSAPWSVLGQSFGGFCALAYLSQAPEGLREALFTGGLPPIGRHPDEIYRATYARVLERNRRYYARYPEDRDRFLAAVAAAPVLASGDRLSPARLRQAGNLLGRSDGPELLHAILELDPTSPAFAHDAESIGFARNPIYAVLHESCYADGHATEWSAQRTMPPEYADDPALLTGEHVYPWMFEELGALRPFAEAAELLAAHPWPRLYDAAVLGGNEVPAAAAVYVEDLYVESAYSLETAAQVRGLRTWVTSEYEHNALRADGAAVLDHLLDLVRGRR